MGRADPGRGGAHFRRTVGAGHALLLPLRLVDTEPGVSERVGFHGGEDAQVPGAWRSGDLRRAREVLVRRAGRGLSDHSKPRAAGPAPRRNDAMSAAIRRRGAAASAIKKLPSPGRPRRREWVVKRTDYLYRGSSSLPKISTCLRASAFGS